MTRVAALAAIWLACLVVAAIALVWMPIALAARARRGWRLAIGFDQLGNTLAGGDEDEVFSSRAWRLRYRQPYRVLQPAIDWAAERLGDGPAHCRMAWINEVSKRAGWRITTKEPAHVGR